MHATSALRSFFLHGAALLFPLGILHVIQHLAQLLVMLFHQLADRFTTCLSHFLGFAQRTHLLRKAVVYLGHRTDLFRRQIEVPAHALGVLLGAHMAPVRPIGRHLAWIRLRRDRQGRADQGCQQQ